MVTSFKVPRPSPVRDAIVSLLEAHPDHRIWSLDELLEEIRGSVSSADFSTVFRATSALQQDQRLTKVDLGDGKVHFEVAGSHHDHIRCRRCQAVAPIPGCVLDEASEQVGQRTGYRVEAHQLLFTGLCPNCQNGSR
ncbi:MAG: Fur family transcriptional regulator [Candidatus Dormibacteraceae bacterium]